MSTVLEDITNAETIEAAVFTALGAASVCWESMEGVGVFDESRATEVAGALLARIGGVA